MVDGAGVAPTGYVADDEFLYRRVLPHYIDWETNPPEPASEAFFDRDFRISVDRAELRGYDPSYTQGGSSNCVCCLLTRSVRKIDEVVKGDSKGGVAMQHNVDVEPVPLPDNVAHAEIFAVPHISNDRLFRRLRHALKRLSSWEQGIAP